MSMCERGVEWLKKGTLEENGVKFVGKNKICQALMFPRNGAKSLSVT